MCVRACLCILLGLSVWQWAFVCSVRLCVFVHSVRSLCVVVCVCVFCWSVGVFVWVCLCILFVCACVFEYSVRSVCVVVCICAIDT